MVLESVENVIFFLVNLSATIAAGTGMVVLQSFFKNKLKDLFNDVNYFIFFFMVSGYILYALGEVSYYLTRQVFKNTSAIGVHDVYWTIGGILILLSFAALAFTLFKEHGGTGKGSDRTKIRLFLWSILPGNQFVNNNCCSQRHFIL
ncbi:hypothetical protein J4479_05330 [Candidatus Woesearchaeota archaeon]|nr:hypothetical protein [Candidatus Woesearchaeota archaeon]